jgi:dephospho-CoA kinase
MRTAGFLGGAAEGSSGTAGAGAPAGAAAAAEGGEPGGRTRVLGVLGGIASGKSRAARLLAGEAGLVISADEIAHEVLRSPEVAARVRERFGDAVLGADGLPDRGALARLAFDPARGPEARRALESWTHPRVRARILERLQEARAAGTPRVVLDVPLLLENDDRHGLARTCDALIFVDAGLELREERARRSRGWELGEIARREAVQLPLAEKRARADFVIPNNGSPAELDQAVRDVLARLGAG